VLLGGSDLPSLRGSFSGGGSAPLRCVLSVPLTVTAVFVLRPLPWWRGTVVERRSLAGELSLSCAGPAADG